LSSYSFAEELRRAQQEARKRIEEENALFTKREEERKAKEAEALYNYQVEWVKTHIELIKTKLKSAALNNKPTCHIRNGEDGLYFQRNYSDLARLLEQELPGVRVEHNYYTIEYTDSGYTSHTLDFYW
jgi:vacuolar-type H+-ATPase subunit E/Vma4